jgi:hypothetical protein
MRIITMAITQKGPVPAVLEPGMKFPVNINLARSTITASVDHTEE